MRNPAAFMWKAIVAGLGAAVTSVTAINAAGAMTWEALAIAIFGAVGTAFATYSKSNSPEAAPAEPKPEVGSQNIPGWTPPVNDEVPLPHKPGLPTAYPT